MLDRQLQQYDSQHLDKVPSVASGECTTSLQSSCGFGSESRQSQIRKVACQTVGPLLLSSSRWRFAIDIVRSGASIEKQMQVYPRFEQDQVQ